MCEYSYDICIPVTHIYIFREMSKLKGRTLNVTGNPHELFKGQIQTKYYIMLINFQYHYILPKIFNDGKSSQNNFLSLYQTAHK